MNDINRQACPSCGVDYVDHLGLIGTCRELQQLKRARESNPVIYLATPYSHEDADVREQRYQQACAAVAKLTANGVLVFSPIVHSHPVAKLGNMEGDFATWERFCLTMLERCDAMLLLMLDGWLHSNGIRQEARHCVAMQKDLLYSDMEGLDSMQWTRLKTSKHPLAECAGNTENVVK